MVPDTAELPLRWSETQNVKWKREIPGRGWSSPIVYRGRIYLTTAVADSRNQDAPATTDRSLRVLCLDAGTGEVIWNTEVLKQNGREAVRIHKKNSHASPTPLIVYDKLFAHFGHQGTACVNLDGSVLWAKQIRYTPVHGNGGSPVVAGDKLIFSCDGPPSPYAIALDVRNGRTAWKTKRNTKAKKPFSFSTPLIVGEGRNQQVVLPGSGNIFAYEPRSGKELWRCNWGEGYSVVCRPVYGSGLIYASSGYDRPVLYAVKVGGRGDVTESHVAWTASKSVPRNASFILVGEELYTIDDRGVASCYDAVSGRVHWQERLLSATSASPIHNRGRIYFIDERGTCAVVEAARKFRVLAENELREDTLASPAVDGNALLIRTEEHLFRIEDK